MTCARPERASDGHLAEAAEGARRLSAEQRKEITSERKKAVAANACTKCGAAAGDPCVEDGRPATIHQRRLNALQGGGAEGTRPLESHTARPS